MGNVSRPLIGLLVATVAFFALWLVALKPSSSSSAPGGVGQYQSAINAAHNAVTVAQGAAAAQGGSVASPSAAPTQPVKPATPAPAATAAPAPKSSQPPAQPATAPIKPSSSHAKATQLSIVERALDSHRVIAMLFYNPAAPDDLAVKQELGFVPRRNGRVVKLAVPISQVSDFPVISNQVSVTQSPTLVLVNPAAQATTIVGFADIFEIAQRVDDALVVK